MMKRFFKWFFDNFSIAIVMMITAGVAAGLNQTREISGSNYRSLIEAWPNAPIELKTHIRESIVNGKISRWDYTNLSRETMKDVGLVIFPENVDREQEREKLVKLIKRE
ncbi:hypothetical protein ACO0LB_17765 [Undibacterium sp. SXout7W]|uniref:hypothetical protein n=1 Tax=Undibacterium sp. SXout7W TaxID=3413049 RepID=UPI003BEF6E50